MLSHFQSFQIQTFDSSSVSFVFLYFLGCQTALTATIQYPCLIVFRLCLCYILILFNLLTMKAAINVTMMLGVIRPRVASCGSSASVNESFPHLLIQNLLFVVFIVWKFEDLFLKFDSFLIIKVLLFQDFRQSLQASQPVVSTSRVASIAEKEVLIFVFLLFIYSSTMVHFIEKEIWVCLHIWRKSNLC